MEEHYGTNPWRIEFSDTTLLHMTCAARIGVRMGSAADHSCLRRGCQFVVAGASFMTWYVVAALPA
jgi:hypothetical protein